LPVGHARHWHLKD